jgi:hypothetical protein
MSKKASYNKSLLKKLSSYMQISSGLIYYKYFYILALMYWLTLEEAPSWAPLS